MTFFQFLHSHAHTYITCAGHTASSLDNIIWSKHWEDKTFDTKFIMAFNIAGTTVRALQIRVIHRRSYNVRGPLALWHIDGHHKLIRLSLLWLIWCPTQDIFYFLVSLYARQHFPAFSCLSFWICLSFLGGNWSYMGVLTVSQGGSCTLHAVETTKLTQFLTCSWRQFHNMVCHHE